jgi:hypothetical protein
MAGGCAACRSLIESEGTVLLDLAVIAPLAGKAVPGTTAQTSSNLPAAVYMQTSMSRSAILHPKRPFVTLVTERSSVL